MTPIQETIVLVLAVGGWAVAAVLFVLMRRLLHRSREESDRYRSISERDDLTGVLNKRALVSRLRESFSQKSPFVTGTLFLIDIDHFKRVNDEHGHAAGDEVLRRVGEALNVGFRSSDVVGRFGGDEFMVYATGLLDQGVTSKKAFGIMDGVRRAGEQSIGEPLTCSIGILAIEGAAATYEDALRQVDEVLYEAKRAGRDCAERRVFVAPERATGAEGDGR